MWKFLNLHNTTINLYINCELFQIITVLKIDDQSCYELDTPVIYTRVYEYSMYCVVYSVLYLNIISSSLITISHHH